MNSRRTISLPEFSKGQWEEPPEPPPHSSELNLVARVRLRLSKLAPLTTVQSWLSGLALPGSVRPWLSERASLTGVRSSLGELTLLTFVRYLIVFFIGVGATVAWQSLLGGTKEETVAATPAGLDSVRQSVDKLAAEVARIRAVEQDILARVSPSPPQPVATPARNPAQRPPPAR